VARTTNVILRLLGVTAALAGLYVVAARRSGVAEETVVEVAPAESVEPAPQLVTETMSIGRGDTLDELLLRAGLDVADRLDMIDAVQKTFDVKKFRAGQELTLLRNTVGDLLSIEYKVDSDRKLQLERAEDGARATIVEIPFTLRTVPVCASLDGSLFLTIQNVGEDPDLAVLMAEIFSFDIDFYRDPRPGDQFCLLVEKKEYENGQAPRYGRILSAEYINRGTRYDAYLFPDPDGKEVYYSGDGRALQAAFLRSPLAFSARVSSHFSPHRLHPVLNTVRPHWGTDYAAPTGTPVRAVGAGTVVFSALSGGSGNLITIRHPNGYETQYLHLSRRLVKKGQKVAQGERIGLVGSTGLATGPHLDLRIRRNGKYLNWERLRLPRVASIQDSRRAAFEAERNRMQAQMSPGLRVLNTVATTAGDSDVDPSAPVYE
jgi:murein DD-endopeptidase MepM/ murein hydrolase activator NlpD